MLKAAEVDFVPEKKGCITMGGRIWDVPNAFAVVRSDTGRPVGKCGKRYNPIPHGRLLAEVGQRLGVAWDQAFVRGDGERMVFGGSSRTYGVNKGDELLSSMYLDFRNNGDAGTVRGVLSFKRIVCANMMPALMRGGLYAKLRHDTACDVEEFSNNLFKMHSEAHRTAELAKAMDAIPVDHGDRKWYFDGLEPEPKQVDHLNPKSHRSALGKWAKRRELLDLCYYHGDGSRETWWGLYNAYTYAIDHTTAGRPALSGTRYAMSTLFGNMAEKKRLAFRSAVNLSGAELMVA
jgi:hypothetical protein